MHPTPRRGDRRRLVAVSAVLLFVNARLAAAPDPYARVTPVPADEPIPVFDFFRPPVFDLPQLNPGGTRFAAKATHDRDRSKVLIHDLVTGKAELIHGSGDRDIYLFSWLDDDHLYYAVSADKHWADGHCVIGVDNLSDPYLIGSPPHFGIVGIPEAKRMQPIVWDGDDEGPVRLNLHATTFGGILDRYRPLKGGDPIGFDCDGQGELSLGYTMREGVATMHVYIDGKWRASPIDLDAIDILGPGDTHTELIVLGPRRDGRPRAVMRMDALTGEPGEILHEDDKYDLKAAWLYRHPSTRKVLGIRAYRRIEETLWLDEGYREKQVAVKAALEKHFPGCVISILGGDRAEKRFFVETYSDRMPSAYHLVDFGKGSVDEIQNTRPWIDPARMRPMQQINFKARDGVALEAYLTLPAGASKENPPPLVVYPHGGPWARDTWGWDRTVQFLASRGYAVLQPQYRGSESFEWRAPEQDRFEFRKMHDDVTAATRALAKSGLVDRDRIAIMGWSFGAWLALCGATFEPDQYRCAVTLAGVYDYAQFMAEARGSGKFGGFDYLRRRVGDPKTQPERFESFAPVRFVSNIKIPIFVGHGRSDQTAEITQATRLIKELERHDITFEKHIEWSEGHGMAFTKNDVELHTKIEAFLAKHLAPRAAPKAAQ